jgi:hypothetical protein
MIISASEAPESRRTVPNSLWYFETRAVQSYPVQMAHRQYRTILLALRFGKIFLISVTHTAEKRFISRIVTNKDEKHVDMVSC